MITSLWQRDFKLVNLLEFFSETLILASVGLIDEESLFPEKFWFVLGLAFLEVKVIY